MAGMAGRFIAGNECFFCVVMVPVVGGGGGEAKEEGEREGRDENGVELKGG